MAYTGPNTVFEIPVEVLTDCGAVRLGTLRTELYGLYSPAPGDPVMVAEGGDARPVNTTVQHSQHRPTQDPAVLVLCRRLVYASPAAARAAVDHAMRREGWAFVDELPPPAAETAGS